MDLRQDRRESSSTSGEYADHMDGILSEALYKIGKRTDKNPGAPKYDESLKETDAVINQMAGEGYMEKHPRSGKEYGIPKQTIISVFSENQIHILGSSNDLEKFKAFTEQQ